MTARAVVETPAIAVAETKLVKEAIAARAQGETSSWREADCYRQLAERGWTQQQIADKCGTRQQRVQKYVACAKNYPHGGNRPSFFDAYQEVNTAKEDKQAVHYSSESPEWYTPPQIIEGVLAVLGEIDVDPCSNPEPHNIPAKDHFTAADDGLSKEWFGRIYMNPPYGEEIGKWIVKLRDEYESGRVRQAIALLPARTDTQWFQPLFDYPCCFVSGRLKFSDAGSAPFPSVLVYFGVSWEKFAATFREIGKTTVLYA